MLLLDEVIEIFRPTPIVLRLEIKCGPDRVPYPGHPEKVIAALAQARVLERSVVTSFQLDTVLAAVAHGRPMRHVWLVLPQLQVDLGLERIIATAKDSGRADAGPAPEHAERRSGRHRTQGRARHRRLGLQRRGSDCPPAGT